MIAMMGHAVELQLDLGNEYTPEGWREGVVVHLLKKGDKADKGKYRGITLRSTVVGITFSEILRDRVGTMLENRKKKQL